MENQKSLITTSTENDLQLLKHGLKNKDVFAVSEIEQKLSMEMIVNSKLPILKYEDKKEITANIIFLTEKFFNSCFPDQEYKFIAIDLSTEIYDNRFTWNLYDCVNFFKHIKQNQQDARYKFFGKPGLLRFIEMIASYEDDRAGAVEQKVLKEIGEQQFGERIRIASGDGTQRSYMGKVYEQVRIENEDPKVRQQKAKEQAERLKNSKSND